MSLIKPYVKLTYFNCISNKGFTLLEVLVALGIAATSLVALYTLANQLLNNSLALDARQAALWCADNHLVMLSLEESAPLVGESDSPCTQMNLDFSVKQVVSNTLNSSFRRVELSVYAVNAVDKTRINTNERLAFLTAVMLINDNTLIR